MKMWEKETKKQSRRKKRCVSFFLTSLSHMILQQEGAASFISVRIPRDSTINNVDHRHVLRLKLHENGKQDDNDDAAEYEFEDFKKDNDSSSKYEDVDKTQRIIEMQQKQIEMLMQMMESKTNLSENSTGSGQQQVVDHNSNNLPSVKPEIRMPQHTTMPPLKAMLFIDGTWLYYSIHQREDERCPIIQRYGQGWQYKYFFDWVNLPRIICEALQKQDQGWSSATPRNDTSSDATFLQSASSPRAIEIVRACVFTSFKADTSKTSFRYQMYQDMINANYDVHMMETVGKGEKCVDIQLAVEMLHYATVPNAYDIALLLSGDKDFMPAMIRTRQKGRRVGLVSMRSGCNSALYESAQVKDYNVVWIEDYLDQLMKRKPSDQLLKQKPRISTFTLMKIINDFISKSGMQRVSSRDLGRYLKQLKVGGVSVLDDVKQSFGGLYQFLVISKDMYIVMIENKRRTDSSDRSFWVSLRDEADQKLVTQAKSSHFTMSEKKFFDEYSLESLEDIETAYSYTLKDSNQRPPAKLESSIEPTNGIDVQNVASLNLPEDLTRDYSGDTLIKLKERCRERGLPVSGKKSEVLERVQNDVEREIASLRASKEKLVDSSSAQKPLDYLHGLILEYIQVSGGCAGSRAVGRYLAVNKASEERMKNENSRISALQELKENYFGLKQFVLQSPLLEYKEIGGPQDDNSNFEFQIALRTTSDISAS